MPFQPNNQMRLKYTAEELAEKIEEYKTLCLSDEMKPLLVGFLNYINLSKVQYFDYKTKPEYAEVIEPFELFLEYHLISHGLDNDYNATIAKILMAKDYGYSEKYTVDNNGDINIKLSFVDTMQESDDEPLED